MPPGFIIQELQVKPRKNGPALKNLSMAVFRVHSNSRSASDKTRVLTNANVCTLMDEEIIRINFPVTEHNCNTVALTDTPINELRYNLEVERDFTIDELNRIIRVLFDYSKTFLFEKFDEIFIHSNQREEPLTYRSENQINIRFTRQGYHTISVLDIQDQKNPLEKFCFAAFVSEENLGQQVICRVPKDHKNILILPYFSLDGLVYTRHNEGIQSIFGKGTQR